MGGKTDCTAGRRGFLVRGGALVAAMSAVAGCITGTGTPTSTPTAATPTPTAAASTPTATPTPSCPNPSPESGKLKFVHCTDRAVCSLELEDTRGNTIEILNLPNTHDKLKPYTVFTYASADYPEIEDDAVYDITATTCEGNDSRTTTDFNFGRGGVYRIHSW